METNNNINFVSKVYSNLLFLYEIDNFTSVVLSLILMIVNGC